MVAGGSERGEVRGDGGRGEGGEWCRVKDTPGPLHLHILGFCITVLFTAAYVERCL